MKTTKTIFALLFSFALIWTQAVSVSAAPVKEKKSCCAHRAVCCCATAPAPNSAPQPSAPPKTASQTEMQSVVAAGLALPQQPASAVGPAFFGHTSLPLSAAVPLYQQNCSFLI